MPDSNKLLHNQMSGSRFSMVLVARLKNARVVPVATYNTAGLISWYSGQSSAKPAPFKIAITRVKLVKKPAKNK